MSSVLISIKNPNDKLLDKEFLNFKDNLEISFYDTEDATGSYATLNKEQAKEIAKFILKNKNEKFLIHCSAGMSRSAGVGKVVELIKIFKGNEYLQSISSSEIDNFCDDNGLKRYFPNFTVQKIITKELLSLI